MIHDPLLYILKCAQCLFKKKRKKTPLNLLSKAVLHIQKEYMYYIVIKTISSGQVDYKCPKTLAVNQENYPYFYYKSTLDITGNLVTNTLMQVGGELVPKLLPN